MLKKFIIEREVPGIGAKSSIEMGEVAQISNGALGQLSGIQWQQSFVTADKTYCVYIAENEALIREHARLSGFPANKITEVITVIDPATEQQCRFAHPMRDVATN